MEIPKYQDNTKHQRNGTVRAIFSSIFLSFYFIFILFFSRCHGVGLRGGVVLRGADELSGRAVHVQVQMPRGGR